MNYELSSSSYNNEDIHTRDANIIRQTYNMKEAQHHQDLTQEMFLENISHNYLKLGNA